MYRQVKVLFIAAALVVFTAGALMADVSYTCNFSQPGLKVSQVAGAKDGEAYQRVELEGCWFKTAEISRPELPYKMIQLIIPAGEEAYALTIDGYQRTGVSLQYKVYPAQPEMPLSIDAEPPAFVPASARAYGSVEDYPGPLARITGSGSLSGYHMVNIRVNPVQYRAGLNQLRLYTQLRFTVKTRPSVISFAPVLRRSPVVAARMENLAKAVAANYWEAAGQTLALNLQAPKAGKSGIIAEPISSKSLPSVQGSRVDYLIITNQALVSAFQPLADWKTRQGLLAGIYSVEWIGQNYQGCDLQEKIRNFIKDAYTYWGTGYVLLAGNAAIVPARFCNGIPSDIYYSDLEGNYNADRDDVYGEGPYGLYPSSEDFVFMDYIDENCGYAKKLGCIKTTDGGMNWSVLTGSPEYIKFFNANQGYGIGITTVDPDQAPEATDAVPNITCVYNSADAGVSWDLKYQVSDLDKYNLSGIFTLDQNHAWAWGSSGDPASPGLLAFTLNGSSWTEVKLSAIPGDLVFVDGNTGYLSGAGGLIMRTTNGGAVWQVQNTGTSAVLRALCFADAAHGWACGEDGTILRYNGSAWTVSAEGAPEDYKDIAFGSADAGLVISSDKILRTTDGGITWAGSPNPASYGLNVVDMVGPNLGWIAGENGLLMKTTDGGLSWSIISQGTMVRLGDQADLYPDLAVGRLPVADATQAGIMLEKIFKYEQNPETDYLEKFLFMGGSLTLSQGIAAQEAEKFQKLYPVGAGIPNSFSKFELYSPKQDPDLTHIEPWWQGDDELSKPTALSAISSGYHFVWHCDHSSEFTMGTGINIQPPETRLINRGDAYCLTNNDRYSIVYSNGCSPNSFINDCISAQFMKNANGGAIGFMGNSVEGHYHDEWQGLKIFQTLFNTPVKNMGDAFRSMQGMFDDGNNTFTQNLLGDPGLGVWTGVPQTLVVQHPSAMALGQNTVEVTVTDAGGNPAVGALVCLQKGTEAFAVGFTDAIGCVTFNYTPETPGTANITVSAANFLPYLGNCEVLPAGGAYVCYDNALIDDSNDGTLNPGETVDMWLSIKNTGTVIDLKPVVEVTTNDPYVSPKTFSTETYKLYPNEAKYCDFPLKYAVATGCPDQHKIVFYMAAGACRDSFTVTVMRDSLDFSHFKIVEVIGNGNGTIELGETIELQDVTIGNIGSGRATGVTAELSTAQNGITITQNATSFPEILAGQTAAGNQAFQFKINVWSSNYNFQFHAYDNDGHQLEKQLILKALPAAPIVKILNTGELIDISWSVLETNNAGYNVYRSQGPGGPYSKINRLPVKNALHYCDREVLGGENYYYSVAAINASGAESRFSNELTNYTTQLCPGWPAGFGVLPDVNWNGPAVGDLNGDGLKETVFAGGGDSLFAWGHDGGRLAGWPQKCGSPINGPVALADLDKDGATEIITAESGQIVARKYDGSELFRWQDQNGFSISSPVVSDIDRDGLWDIVYTSPAGKFVTVITYKNGAPGFLWTYCLPQPPSPVAVGDVTGDSRPEVVFGTWSEDGSTYVLDNNGEILPGWPQKGGYCISCAPCLADINKDSKKEVIIGALLNGYYSNEGGTYILFSDTKMNVWDGSGIYLPGWPYSEKDKVVYYWSTPSVCDYNKDGNLEISACSYKNVKVWNSNGVIIKDQAINSSHSAPLPVNSGSSGSVHLLYREDKGLMGSFNLGGACLSGFPMMVPDYSYATPVMADMNNDGYYEIISDAVNGYLYAWQANIPSTGPADWPMQGHDVMRTSRHSALIDYHGHINRNMTLSGDNYLSGDIVIDPGVTVNILPGARLYFAANKDAHDQGADALRGELIVKGELLVQGAVGDSVYLGPWTSAPAAGNWHGIVVEPGGNVQLDYCVIENAVVGLQSVNVNVLPQISVTNSRIQGCNTGFYFNNSAAQIKNNLIVDNKPPAMFGKGVFKASSDTFAGKSVDSTVFIGTGIEAINSNLTLENNVIRNNFIGYYGGGSIQGAITNNTFEDNEYQGMDLYGDGYNMTITGNNFYRNAVPLNGTNGWEWAGISIGYREISTASSIIIEGNTFTGNHTGARCTRYGSEAIAAGFSLIMRDNNFSTGNEVGLKIATDVSPNLTAIATGNYFTGNTIYGVYVNAVNSCPLNLGDLSNASLTDNGGNRIYNNGIYDLYYAVPTPIAMKAEGNFWNKKLASQIDPRIYDDNENSAYGSVDFQPFYIWDWPEEDAVWSGVVSIAGDVVVPEDGTLKIEPGTVVRFIRDFDAAAGGNDPAKAELIIYGQLELKGKPGEPPVIFQSDAHSPQSGDWGGIVFKQAIAASKACTEVALRGSGTKGVSTREMKNCIVRHAVSGISLGGDQKLELKQCKLEQNATGLSFYGQATAECKDDTIANNNTGIACKDYSVPIFKNSYLSQNKNNGVVINDNAQPNFGDDEECGHNIISSNLPYNIYNASNNNIMAKKNYWGTMNVDTVAKYIFDGNDQSGLGLVSYLPLWEGPRDRPHGGAQLEESAIALPTTFSLLQNTPNPMVGFTAINFAVAKPGNVSLKIYNISGQLVKTLVNENKQQGFYNVKWDGKDESFQQTAAGVYFYRIQANGFDNTKKMVVLK